MWGGKALSKEQLSLASERSLVFRFASLSTRHENNKRKKKKKEEEDVENESATNDSYLLIKDQPKNGGDHLPQLLAKREKISQKIPLPFIRYLTCSTQPSEPLQAFKKNFRFKEHQSFSKGITAPPLAPRLSGRLLIESYLSLKVFKYSLPYHSKAASASQDQNAFNFLGELAQKIIDSFQIFVQIMAEAIAALSLAATIIQVVDYGTKVIVRLKDFHASIVQAPKSLRDILVQLPLILDTLERTRLQAESNAISQGTQNALLPVVQGCYAQITELHKVLAKVMPDKTDSSLLRSKKAIQSVGYEKTIKDISATLRNYVQILTYHQATSHGSSQNRMPPGYPPIQAQKPYFGVPFDRDRRFIGRVDILQQVENAVAQFQSVALAGIGGVGKSQIAIEAAYRYQESEPGHVFWVHASTMQRFDQGYRDIARRFLPPPDTKNDGSHVLNSVRDWLSEHAQWLLILDNADDLELFFSATENAQPLINYLPHSQRGRILITSRDRRVGERLAGRENCITVLPPDHDEARELVQSKLAPQIWDKHAAGSLIEALERLPLAITQAAAFISENNLTIGEYLKAFQADDSELVDLLSEDSGDTRRDFENGNSVMRTWKLSFDQINSQKPRAAEILSLMAVLDRQGVPKDLLMEENERKTEFMTAIGTLQAFSLINVVKTNLKVTYEMHRLVQLAMILWLKSQRTLADWQRRALVKLEDEFPFFTFELSAVCESLYPHGRLAVDYRFDDPTTRLLQADLMTQVAAYEVSRFNLGIAHDRLIVVCKCREELLGRDHISTLTSRFHMADTLRMQASPEAEILHRELLPKFEEITGPVSSSSLAVKMGLALTLKDNIKTEKLLREVAAGAQEAGDMENYAIALNNLGVCLLSQGKRVEAVKYHQMALEEKDKLLGPNHASTLQSMMNLNVATDPSDNEEGLYRDILAKQEQILGAEHPSTLLSLINLARTLMRDKRYEEAEPLALRALAGKEKILGASHPTTLTAIDTVAALYNFMEQYETSKAYFERALKEFDKVLGQHDHRTQSCWWGYLALPREWRGLDEEMFKDFAADHPVSIVRLNYEAATFYDRGDYRQAEEIKRKALALFESVLGLHELWTLDCAHDLGLILIELWKFEEAETLFRRVLAGRKRQLPLDHRDTLRTMNALGVTLWNLKGDKLLEAEQLFKDLLAIRETLGQTDDIGHLGTRNNLGLLEIERGDFEAALKTYKALLIDRQRVQGDEHRETLFCMLSISMVLAYMGEYEESREWNEKAVRGLVINPGAEHPDALIAQSHLAKLLSVLGELDEAEETIRSVIATREKILGLDHGVTLKSRSRLAAIFEMQGRLDEALILEEDIYAAAVESFGIDHPETRGHKQCLDDLKQKMFMEVDDSLGLDYDGSGDESEKDDQGYEEEDENEEEKDYGKADGESI